MLLAAVAVNHRPPTGFRPCIFTTDRGLRLIMMRSLFLAAVASLTLVGQASASVLAKVDLAGQEMEVWVDGEHRFTWPVATGRRGYETPTGSYRAKRLEREWYSTKYDDAPMPHSVFFNGGYAIHGAGGRKGRPASHGCVRLDYGNAATFYRLVASHGAGSTRIVIED